MKIFLIDRGGWGVDFEIVRAVDEAQVSDRFLYKGSEASVTELSADGDPASLWAYEFCPDSPRE